MRVSAFIQAHTILGSLSPTNQERLARFARVKVFEPGERVFSQGDKADACFALNAGNIKVYQNSPDGREVFVKMVRGGDIFGEVILFSQMPYPAHAEATEPSSVICIDRQAFIDLLADTEFRNDFMKNILDKLRYLTGRVYSLMAYDVEERFFRYLLDNWGPQDSYTITMSKKDFASAIGTIPETFSRLLKRLSERRAIAWEGDELKVDMENLLYYQGE